MKAYLKERPWTRSSRPSLTMAPCSAGSALPGMILTAKELLKVQKHPSVDEIKHAISGNFCRCTGYTKIVEAIEAASES